MKPGDIIYEQGGYKVVYTGMLPVSGSVYINNEHKPTPGHKGFKFALFKNEVGFKFFSLATGFPYNYEKMKSEVIEAFKKFMV